ncbi:Lin0368 family putative glycerol transporter subunit [Wukongibacter sp. M2B1]
MTIGLMISTFTGAFISPFLITLCWGKMVEFWGAIGAFILSTLL